MDPLENNENDGSGVFAWCGKACGRAQIGVERSFARQKPGADWKKRLANLWSKKKITKTAHAGRGHETKWEMSIKI
jgi:hypothetical protein